MKVSVVICTKDRHSELLCFLESLVSQTRQPEELVVVDASEKPGLDALINSKFNLLPFAFIYIKSKPNLPAQRKVGLDKSSGDIICYFDDDVVLEQECIEEVANVFENDKEGTIGGVTGKQLNVTKNAGGLRRKLKFVFKYLFFMQYDDGDGKFRYSGHPKPVYSKGEDMYVEFLSGCFMCYRRNIIESVGIDVGTSYYNEDVDLSYRVSRNYTCFYAHKARLTHNRSTSWRDKSYERSRESIRAQIYVFRKNIPKKPLNVTAFVLSILGFLILTLASADLDGFLGGIRGILT